MIIRAPFGQLQPTICKAHDIFDAWRAGLNVQSLALVSTKQGGTSVPADAGGLASSSGGGKSSNVGAIAGGIIGGIVAGFLLLLGESSLTTRP